MLDRLADQLAIAVAARDFLHARALAGSIASSQRSVPAILAEAARDGVDAAELAALSARSATLAARLDELLAQAPVPLPGLGVDLTDPVADQDRETAWLARPPAPPPRATDERWSHLNGTGARPDAEIPATAEGTDGFGLSDLGRLAFASPLVLLPPAATDALGGPLFARLRSHDSVDHLVGAHGTPGLTEVAAIVGDLANDPAFAVGFGLGAMVGTSRAIYDSVAGLEDTGRLIAEISVALLTYQHRDLLARATKAIDQLVTGLPQLLDQLAERWRDADPYRRGRFQGEVVSYVVTQLAIVIAGSLAGGPALGGPFGKVVQALQWIDNPIAGLTELAGSARLSATALEALRGGRRALPGMDPLADLHDLSADASRAGNRTAAHGRDLGDAPGRAGHRETEPVGEDLAADAVDTSIRGSSPSAVFHGYQALSTRQAALLARLPESMSEAIVPRRMVRLTDLATLTAKTGDELALFTRGSQRLVVRGTATRVPLSAERLRQLAADGWRWSGHSHPGMADIALDASPGDRAVLELFEQDHSAIVNTRGARSVFDQTDDRRVP